LKYNEKHIKIKNICSSQTKEERISINNIYSNSLRATFSTVSVRTGTDSSSEQALRKRIVFLLGLLLLTRIGVYVPMSSKIDLTAFTGAVESGWSGGYIEALTGGSISKAGLFSLGIVPFINASIFMQLMTSLFPNLKKLSRDEGVSGRRKFLQYQKLLTLFFSIILAYGQLNYIQPFVTESSAYWLLENSIVLATGAIILTFLSDEIDKLKLGNGTSILIFSNILSAIPLFSEFRSDQIFENLFKNILILLGLFILTILGIVYVQEAEMKIPINYTSRLSTKLTQINTKSYLPLKVNATGVMPIIFASSILALPEALSQLTDNKFFKNLSITLNNSNSVYTFYTLLFIFLFNYLYTLLQLDPDAVSDNLKKSGASISAIRPGKTTIRYLERKLVLMSILGSAFLGILALAPSFLETLSGLLIFRGFGGSSILILVGVATDFARKFRAEKLMQTYNERNNFYT
jgi:preprotein translocase SecY subunit